MRGVEGVDYEEALARGMDLLGGEGGGGNEVG